MTDWLTHEDFADRVGETFDLALGDGDAVALTLQQAVVSSLDGGPGPDGTARRQFSLVFTGPSTPLLRQATWRLTHRELGTFETFLVPLGPAGEAMRYEAVYA